MPDPTMILTAAIAAGLIAAVALLATWPWRLRHSRLVAGAGTVGVGAAIVVGAILLGIIPKFPPREDLDRLLLVVVPTVVVVEIAVGLFGRAAWAAWFLRFALAAGVPPILLHGSVYLTTPSNAETTSLLKPGPSMLQFELALALAANWWLLQRLSLRSSAKPVLTALAFSSAGAGLSIMLSGYATGGQVGFPMTAALIGLVVASMFFRPAQQLSGAVGIGVVGLFALLVVGSFFGNLTTTNAVLLFTAPLLAWLVEMPGTRTIRPSLRFAMAVFVVSIPVAIAVGLSAKKFAADSQRPGTASGPSESSANDYLQFGK